MTEKCSIIQQKYREDIRKIVDIQRNEMREAIFFIYEDERTEGPFKGQHTSINLTRDQEKKIQRKGNIVGSVHTHPTGFDPSTIDIVTGIASGQDAMCVATPINPKSPGGDYVLTCMDFGVLSKVKQQQVKQAMRRSSVGVTNIGRVLRREFNFKRFNLDQCRIEG